MGSVDGAGFGGGFALVIVLFILLIIIGCSCLGGGYGGDRGNYGDRGSYGDRGGNYGQRRPMGPDPGSPNRGPNAPRREGGNYGQRPPERRGW